MKADQLLEGIPAPGIESDLQEEMESVAVDIVTEFWFQPSMSELKGVMEAETSDNNPTFCFSEGASCKYFST